MFFYKINIVIFFLLASHFCLAQNQNNVWYFGNRAGISFNSNVISTLNDGALNHTEGVSSICDINGDLLFYTNGINIWNINNEPMPNGTGLLGNNSSAQVLILPKPGDCNIYYVFTTPPQGSEGGAYYSVIDMRKNNGRGDVVTKNIFLVELVTERITATYKNNGVDYWVMLQELGSNGFLAFSVTAAGVNLTPIISFSGLPNALSDDVVGCMKFSKNGSKLCTANELGFKKCQLFDFNNTTGVVSNGFVLSDTEAYGVEFSDDDSKLYLCRYTGFKLTQYDLTSNNPVVIKNSETLIAIAPIAQNNNGGALQIGPDKKIYVARDSKAYLDVIQNPNASASGCGYVNAAVNLNFKLCYAGLPNFIKNFPTSFCGSLKATYTQAGLCGGNNTTINVLATYGTPPYQYSIDGVNFQTSNLFNNVAAKDYEIAAKDAFGEIRYVYLKIPVTQNFTIVNSKIKKPDCGIANGSIVINTNYGVTPFLFSKDGGASFQTDSTFLNIGAATYNFLIKDANNCTDSKLITVSNNNPLKIFAGNDTGIFINQTIPLFAKDLTNSNFINYKWTPAFGLDNQFSQNPIATITSNILYTVEATNILGCTATDSIYVEVYKEVGLFVPTAFSPNGDGKNDFLKAIPRGIKQVNYFTIYNRYGATIFQTKNLNIGWNGLVNGIPQNTGTYVWIAQGIDINGKMVNRKGTFTLLR